jgi:hypothetical protein
MTDEQKEKLLFLINSTNQDIDREISLQMRCDDYRLSYLNGRKHGVEKTLEILGISVEQLKGNNKANNEIPKITTKTYYKELK